MSKSKQDKVESEKETSEGTGVVGDADLETLKKALAEAKEEAEKYLSNWQRAEADFSNYRKRTEQEKSEMANLTNNILMLNLLPILDDFERAFASLTPKLSSLTWINGIRLIFQKLKTTLETQGLLEVKVPMTFRAVPSTPKFSAANDNNMVSPGFTVPLSFPSSESSMAVMDACIKISVSSRSISSMYG